MSVSEAPTEQTAHRPTEHLQGIVERVTYHAEDSGYTVARLKVPSHTDLVTIVGRFPCTGYLDHPFENKPVKTGKDLLRLLANRGGWMYNPKLSPAYSCSTTLFSQDGETS